MPNMHLSLLLQNILKRGSTYLVFLFIYHSLPIKIPTGQTGTKVQMEGIPGLTWLSFYPRVKVASYAFSTTVLLCWPSKLSLQCCQFLFWKRRKPELTFLMWSGGVLIAVIESRPVDLYQGLNCCTMRCDES